MDRVHAAWTSECGSGPPWTEAARTRGRRCSPMVVEEDEAVPKGCSLEHEQRRRGDAMEAKNGDGLSSARGRRKARGSSGERGKRGGEIQGCSSPFIGAEGALGRGGLGGNGQR
jgi:hypothetical protein